MDEKIVDKVKNYFIRYRDMYPKDVNFNKIANDTISEDRINEQIKIFLNTIRMSDYQQKRLLEIGSGFGVFIAVCKNKYNIDAYGIEPDEEIFNIAKEVLHYYNIKEDVLKKAEGEDLPFEDSSFDLIYSSMVLEHVKNPEKVIDEALRVLKKGGYLQFVIPNYNSFWEGHYGVIMFPYIPKWLAKIYVSLLGRDSNYINSLQFITPKILKKILRKYENIEILSWGIEIFEQRFRSLVFIEYGFLYKLKPYLKIIHKLRLVNLVIFLCKRFGWYNPIILTIKKK